MNRAEFAIAAHENSTLNAYLKSARDSALLPKRFGDRLECRARRKVTHTKSSKVNNAAG
jgi:hypothetical protein